MYPVSVFPVTTEEPTGGAQCPANLVEAAACEHFIAEGEGLLIRLPLVLLRQKPVLTHLAELGIL